VFFLGGCLLVCVFDLYRLTSSPLPHHTHTHAHTHTHTHTHTHQYGPNKYAATPPKLK
jgi:hypothetical protein